MGGTGMETPLLSHFFTVERTDLPQGVVRFVGIQNNTRIISRIDHLDFEQNCGSQRG